MSIRPDRSLAVVWLCFLLSGFAALLYQTVWTREFAFVFGTSDLAVATVLAAYMAGLAIGAAATARLIARVRRPVRVYAALELSIALCALAVPFAIAAMLHVSVAVFGGRSTLPAESEPLLGAFWLLSSIAILIVPTALMGATLPLLARHVVHRDEDIGSRIGALYAINTLGAVMGTVVAAFLILPAFGLRGTVWVGVAANAAVFALAAGLGRDSSSMSGSAHPCPETALDRDVEAPTTGDPKPRDASGARFVLPLIFLSGAASFTYEVLWTRLLGHVVGGSVFAFATMLASFLAGITLGSFAGSRLATTRARAARGLSLALFGGALTSLIAFFALRIVPALAGWLGAGIAAGPGANALLSGFVLVPSTLCIGATFPFAVRVLARSPMDAGASSARIYAWNTAGAIVGALGAGFLIIPALGFAGTLTFAVVAQLALAIACVFLAPPVGRRIAIVAAIAAVVTLAAPPDEPWSLLRWSPFERQPATGEMTWFGVGRSATVLLHEGNSHWVLRSNGLPEAAILPPGQRSINTTAEALGVLPVLARPDAHSMLVVGFGGGTALESVPPSIRSLDVIELEPKMIDANRALSGLRARDPLADPRVHVHIGDARGALLLTSQRWDTIVSQPSHPWTAGASHLYTREFFALVREHLAPRGVFLQWIGASFVDDALLRSLVATLNDVFPYVRVYRPAPRPQILFLASDAPLPIETDATAALTAMPQAFDALGYACAEDTLAALSLDEASSRAFAATAPISTDDRNLLQMRSPAILRAPLGIPGTDAALAASDPLPRLERGFDRLYLVRRLLADGDDARVARLVASLDDPDERRVASTLRALHALDSPDPAVPIDANRARARRESASRELRDVIARRPGLAEARYAWVRLQRDALLAGDAAVMAEADALDPLGRAIVAGWRAESNDDPAALQALDATLESHDPRAPGALEALRLRIFWRLAFGGIADAGDALSMIDRRLALGGNQVGDILLRARASLILGRPLAVVGALSQIALRLDARRPADRLLAAEALTLLAQVRGREIGFTDQRPAIAQRLERLTHER